MGRAQVVPRKSPYNHDSCEHKPPQLSGRGGWHRRDPRPQNEPPDQEDERKNENAEILEEKFHEEGASTFPTRSARIQSEGTQSPTKIAAWGLPLNHR